MAAISETLRQARLRSGVDLDSLAAKTKINPRYLQAIEDGAFEKLPGGIFARMFVKQYADAVGLDGASFADEFQRNSPSFGYTGPDIQKIVETRDTFHPSVPRFSSTGLRGDRMASMLSSLIWVLAAVLFCAGAYYALAHLPGKSPDAVAQAVPKPKPAPEPQPEPQPETKPEPPVVTPAPVPPAANEVAAKTPDAPPQTPAPPTKGPIQVVLTATELTWVSVTADGKTIMSEAMQPGTTKSFSAEKGARLNVGNAGGIEITFNGKKLEPVGPRGQVRNVDFTTFGAQVVARTPPPASPTADPPPNPDPLR